MRIKARALGLAAEDYFNDQVLEDSDLLYGGTRQIDTLFWQRQGEGLRSWTENSRTYYEINGPDCSQLLANQFLWQDDESFVAKVKSRQGNSAILETLRDYSHQKIAYGALQRAIVNKISP